MSCSPAKLAANRRNAALSTGPRTAEGKERSRANALKHGMAGEGIALPNEDAAEVSRRFVAMDEELRPEGELARALVRRVALMTVRLERSARYEAAALTERVHHAGAAFDDRKAREVEVLANGLAIEPETNSRRLRMSVEGIDWMLKKWDDLRYDLHDADRDRWGRDHALLADNLMGRKFGYIKASRVRVLTAAMEGDFHALDDSDGGELDDHDRCEWARAAMDDLIGAEMEGLRLARAAIDAEAVARDRAAAADLALFDDSPKAILARRYEAAAERGLYRALRAIKEHAIAADDPVEVAPADPVGSSRPAPAPAPAPAIRPESRQAPIAAAPAPVASSGTRRRRDHARSTNDLDLVVGRQPASASARSEAIGA